jgi:ABC-type branched-subunit amino acid transport system substrate-binding protein
MNKSIHSNVTAFVFLSLLLLITIGFVACNKDSTQNAQSAIKVGAILPLTGEAAAYGKSAQQGIEVALARYSNSFPS